MASIYVASLSDYNAGRINGEWIDLAGKDVDDVNKVIADILVKGGGDEWAIHDFEGFEGIRIGEHESLETVVALAEAVEEHGAAFAAYWENFWNVSDDVEGAVKAFLEDYQGAFQNLEDYAEQTLEDTGGLDGVPEHLRNYIDFASFGRDMELGGDIWTHRNPDTYELYVYRNC